MLTVLEEILDLPGFKITQVEQKSNELHIHLDHLSKCAQCPACGNKSERFHQNHWRKVRDLPLSTKATFLYFSKRRFECLSCREVFSESLLFLTPHRLYTKRYEEYIYKLVKHNNVSYVKDFEDLSYEVIEKIFLSSQIPSSSKSL